MQILPIYLYNHTLDVILDTDPTVRGAYRVMYQHDLKIQKGIKNVVRVQFKNSDQKKITINNTQTYVFSMFDALNQRLILEKQLEILDTGTYLTRGLAELTFTESDTLNLTKSSYTYSIKYQDPTDGTFLPAYSNTYYGMKGTVYLLDDIQPVLQPAQEVVSFLKRYNQQAQRYEHTSGPIYAHPEFKSNAALHTLAMYMTGYRGTVNIFVSLLNSPNDTDPFALLETRTYNGFTGIDYMNFNGIYTYIKIQFIPAFAPAESNNDNPAFYGSFDKVLYKT